MLPVIAGESQRAHRTTDRAISSSKRDAAGARLGGGGRYRRINTGRPEPERDFSISSSSTRTVWQKTLSAGLLFATLAAAACSLRQKSDKNSSAPATRPRLSEDPAGYAAPESRDVRITPLAHDPNLRPLWARSRIGCRCGICQRSVVEVGFEPTMALLPYGISSAAH